MAPLKQATWAEIRKVLRDPTIQVGLAGPPGVGKTYALFEIGKKLKKITHKIQAHAELSPAEILGMYVPDGTKFRWEPGPIDVCYSKGGILIVDEIIESSGPVKTFLYGAFDRGPGGTISYVGRTFVQKKGYQPVATMNGYPDQGGLPEALLDRFDAWFLVMEPSEEQYALLEPDLQEICRDSYAGASDPMQGPLVTFRLLLGVQKLRKILPIESAVLAACYSNQTLANSLLEVLELSDPVESDIVAPAETPEEEDLEDSDDDDDADDEDDWDDDDDDD